jgi:hypothetical protein
MNEIIGPIYYVFASNEEHAGKKSIPKIFNDHFYDTKLI